jgi:flagellar basal-body rod modification protein FlgD
MTSVQSVTSTGPPAGGMAAAAGAALGKDDFLRLLITQLRHQDPLNPLDQNQFLAQTAQFTSLEYLQNIASGVEALREAKGGIDLSQAAALLGRTAVAAGRELPFDGGPAALTFALLEPASSARVDVLDGQGRVVRQLPVGPHETGSATVTWDGLDAAGRVLAPGTYFYRVTAWDAGGQPTPVAVAAGTLSGLQVVDGGRVRYWIGDVAVRQEDLVEIA